MSRSSRRRKQREADAAPRRRERTRATNLWSVTGVSSDGLWLTVDPGPVRDDAWSAGQGPWWYDGFEVVEHPELVELWVYSVNAEPEHDQNPRDEFRVRLSEPLGRRPVLDLHSTVVVRPEVPPEGDDESGGATTAVPFESAKPLPGDRLVLRWMSQPGFVFLGANVEVAGARVVVTIREYHGWANSTSERRLAVVEAPGIPGDAEIVDGARPPVKRKPKR